MSEELDRILKEAANAGPFQHLLAAPGPSRVAHAPAPGHGFAAAVLAQALESPVLVLAHEPRVADTVAAGASVFLGSDRVVRFPAWESLPYEGISPGPQVAGARARAAHRVRNAQGRLVVVAPVLAGLQGLVPDLGSYEPLAIEAGTTLPPDVLAEGLAAMGYARAEVVEHRGEFAVRGGIVDLFPSTARRPTRLEYFGDEVESLREFAPATQLSTGKLDRVEVYPCRELVVGDDVRLRADEALPLYRGQYRAALERLSEGLAFEGMEQAIPLLYQRLPFLADLLSAGGWVLLSQAKRTADRARQIVEEADALADASGWPGPRVLHDLDAAIGAKQRVDLTEFAWGNAVDLGMRMWESPGRVDPMVERIRALYDGGAALVLAAEGRGSLERSREVLASRGLSDAGLVAVEAEVGEGFWLEPDDTRAPTLALVTEEDLFGRRRHTRVAPRLARRGSEAVAVELEPGDLAVHQVHGVGRYAGMVRRAVAGAERDYLLLEYAEGDRLYVPTDQVGIVAKYVGGEAPRLHRLGGSDWVRAKTRVRRAVRDMAGELVRLYSVRMSVPGHAFGPDTPWQAELEDAFPHEETRDQLAAVEEVKLAMLSRFVSPREQAGVLEDAAKGSIDVLIGTHRLLSQDVKFKDLGLLVVDEEQRFGVVHKEQLKRIRASADVLTMTATPIPRTLEMALSGIREMSVVDTPPEDRQPVLTYVGPYDEDMALGAVRRELLRGGQVFWVHNRVETIERTAGALRSKLPDARIVVAHGQLDEERLEKMMIEFWDRSADVLVCTTIIESGLDVPSANTLVVERADRLGLAQLYQLRGRVGRSAERAFAYLFFPIQARLTDEAHERLGAISRFTALGSGFHIAMRDLEIRGAGNLLGAEQHGHIATVGFDTYLRLLAESVAEMKGEPLEPERDIRIDLPVKAFVPPEWVGQEA